MGSSSFVRTLPSRVSRILQQSPLASNSLVYGSFALVGSTVVQVAQQWKLSEERARAADRAVSCSSNKEKERSHKKNEEKHCEKERSDADAIPDSHGIPYYSLPLRLQNRLFHLDLAHILGMVFFGVFYNGPANAVIYPLYSRVFKKNVNLCILFDQTFYMPCCAVPACWLFSGTVQNFLMRDPRKARVVDEEASVRVQSANVEWTVANFHRGVRESVEDMQRNWLQNVMWTWCVWIPAESVNMRFVPVHLRSPVAGFTSFAWTTGMAVWTYLM